MTFYRRNLPHWHPDGATYFITMRLAGTLPQETRDKLKHFQLIYEKKLASSGDLRNKKIADIRLEKQRRIFKKYEDVLDGAEVGPTWLDQIAIAEIVETSLKFRNGSHYDLISYCIMPNHVHVVLAMNGEHGDQNESALSKVLRNLKSYTAQIANRELGRTGAFWQAESYDHVVRDSDELLRIVKYVLQNPVKACLVNKWQEWNFTYLSEGIKRTLFG